MKDLLRDDLKYNEIPPKPQEKDPLHHLIKDFAYFCRYGHLILPTYPEYFCPNFLFGKSMAGKYPTYLRFGHMSKIS